MGQGEVWKKRRTGLAGALRDGRKTWLSFGDASDGVEERKQEQGHDVRPWRMPIGSRKSG